MYASPLLLFRSPRRCVFVTSQPPPTPLSSRARQQRLQWQKRRERCIQYRSTVIQRRWKVAPLVLLPEEYVKGIEAVFCQE